MAGGVVIIQREHIAKYIKFDVSGCLESDVVLYFHSSALLEELS